MVLALCRYSVAMFIYSNVLMGVIIGKKYKGVEIGQWG